MLDRVSPLTIERMIYRISKPNRHIVGQIILDGSKSISNRALMIQALCPSRFNIDRISSSKDTQTLIQLLAQTDGGSYAGVYDAGAAGTTFRFMTAFLALQDGIQILTGSDRMQQRPIGKLVDALRTLGCDIEYLKHEGYPPLKINTPKSLTTNTLSIAADTSSQYITALLLIAPTLQNGLRLTLEGTIVSRPYIEMTLGLMADFGVKHSWSGHTIVVEPQAYQARDLTVEADWSAASYYYALAAFADELDLTLNGLFKDSLQGDAVAVEMGLHFGINTEFMENGLRLTKSAHPIAERFEWDFVKCPDIAQTFAVICAGVGIQGWFTGLETLFIKETDRVAALQNELAKVGVSFIQSPVESLPESLKQSENQYFTIDGKAEFATIPTFPTYEDHRMAMSFAPLAMFNTVRIEDPAVVSKSYYEYWNDLQKLGFVVEEVQA
jgi:3-phosphoshikimate 1-carboxyvinyltransferase